MIGRSLEVCFVPREKDFVSKESMLRPNEELSPETGFQLTSL